MPEIIASTYEKLGYVGAGGGGNVFLARHMRLNKLVVLKADKRKITASPELLRREVDVLKNISHPYIPKVYDYFAENDTVYTVMDYIEGESLDKPLKNGVRFSQPQIIEWAKELLEALKYLHSPIHGNPPKGYVHSDIKPANLMVTPLKTICLIDFNIALALGEENLVGASLGYASPEHYGLDYSTGFTSLKSSKHDSRFSSGRSKNTADPDATVLMEENIGTASKSSSTKKIVPDVRSDIYSTGATLYHLISGIRPAADALEIVPLSDKVFNPQLAAIINKAMNPNPDLRYQTAEEMLYDLEHLHENDPRVKKQKKALKIFEGCMAAMLAIGLFSSFVGLRRIQQKDNSLKLAEYSVNETAKGNMDMAVKYALDALPENGSLFAPKSVPQAQSALTEALQVYDLSDSFRPQGLAELPSAPQSLVISPDGKTFACICSGQGLIYDTDTEEMIDSFPVFQSALSDIKYIDSNRIAYAGEEGLTVYSISEKTRIWSGKPATAICVSRDGSTVAGIFKEEAKGTVYDAETGEEKGSVDFDGKKQSTVFNDGFVNPRNNLYSLNKDGTMLAASFDDGTLSVYRVGQEELFTLEKTDYIHFEGGFYENYLAFAAVNSTGSIFAVLDCGSGDMIDSAANIRLSSDADEDGIYLQNEELLVKVDPKTGEQTPLAHAPQSILKYSRDKNYAVAATKEGVYFYGDGGILLSHFDISNQNETADFVQVKDGYAVIGSQNSNLVRIMKYVSHEEAEVLEYDRESVHDEARISADKSRVILFSYDEFSVYNTEGGLVTRVAVPDSDKVYDQQLVRENGSSRLEITYYSGKVSVYSGDDGSLMGETMEEPPDKNIEDVFYTDRYKIVSPLQGAPVVYDKNSGQEITRLDEDAYLTYLTQQGEYIIAQYVKTNDEFYGVLMNENLEALARLPNLCDVYDNELYFDYKTGNLRKTHIYTLDELTELAREIQKGDVNK